MNSVNQTFDSRAMPLLEPSTAPIAYSLWGWLAERFASRGPNPRDPVSTQPAARQDADRSASQTPR